MKKLIALSALALTLTACAPKQDVHEHSEDAGLRAAVEEARAAAIQANENARIARELAEQNAEKINRTYRSSQRK